MMATKSQRAFYKPSLPKAASYIYVFLTISVICKRNLLDELRLMTEEFWRISFFV